MSEQKQIDQQQVAEQLIFPLWRCLADEYKERYKKEVWEQFENNIRAASYTSSLNKFLAGFTSLMPVQLQVKYMEEINAIISSGQDDIILDWLRDETTYLVMIARLMNQARKEDLNQMNLFDENKKES